jgi:hypothetical protein
LIAYLKLITSSELITITPTFTKIALDVNTLFIHTTQ